MSRSGWSASSASGSSAIGCTMRLVSPDFLCADFCTQCPMRRQTAHSLLNKRIGLVCICGSGPISRLEWLCYCCQDTRYCRLWSLDSSHFFSVQKHDQGWRSLDLVAVGEFLIDCGINSEDLLFGLHRFRPLLKDRLDRPAVYAAVRHEIHPDPPRRFLK